MADTSFQFPNFNMPGFPYANLPQQIQGAFAPQQFSNGSQYGRWNGVSNNAFGLFPNQFGALFGYQPQGAGMQFQPPWGGMMGQGQPQMPSGQMPPQAPQAPQGGYNGMGPPTQTPSAGGWQGFNFAHPANPQEQNFNSLMQRAGPAVAYSYLMRSGGAGSADFLNQFIANGGDRNTANQVVNNFAGGGNYGNQLGMQAGYGTFNRQGQFVYQPPGTNRSTATPQTFSLPFGR